THLVCVSERYFYRCGTWEVTCRGHGEEYRGILEPT
uniref:Uncharacterized protein n=1 Tax=Amphimedon queenslandica TaxID=400682 RepID=A0A1X7V6P8_AMPQE